MSQTSSRKSDHLRISLSEDILYHKSTGFERYDFVHYASSELTVNDVDTRVNFFGKEISFPFLISCMTGGTDEAENINALLAEIAEELNIPIGVGSQRALLESEKNAASFQRVKEIAKNVPVLGNIGAAEFVKFEDTLPIYKLIESVNASAVVIHLNLLQEMVQPEGTPVFKGLLSKIEKFAKELSLPLIAKEVGFGISKDAARDLLNAGIKGIDVAGAGGTSWSKIEAKRNDKGIDKLFGEWGLPTSYCIRTVSELKNEFDFLLIGSGGIKDSESFAKSLALGADLSASARTVLKMLSEKGTGGVIELLSDWFEVLKKIMVLTNSKNINELKGKVKRIEELI